LDKRLVEKFVGLVKAEGGLKGKAEAVVLELMHDALLEAGENAKPHLIFKVITAKLILATAQAGYSTTYAEHVLALIGSAHAAEGWVLARQSGAGRKPKPIPAKVYGAAVAAIDSLAGHGVAPDKADLLAVAKVLSRIANGELSVGEAREKAHPGSATDGKVVKMPVPAVESKAA
jgi:hypothetical protein